jgi:hypothetical protein
MDRLEELFARLDTWRHLPSYQLERRADIFFSLYLVPILERRFETQVHLTIVPEWPVPTSLSRGGTSFRSYNIDYVLFSAALDHVFFVELKTDDASRGPRQDAYLADCCGREFVSLVRGVIEIAQRSLSTRKYYRLLNLLAGLGIVEMDASVGERLRSREPIHPHVLFAGVKPGKAASGITAKSVVYIQPTARDADNCISFADLAATVGSYDDALSMTFARYLVRWAKKAGEPA